MNKNEQILEVIEGFKNLTSKIKEDNDNIKNSLKNKDLTINACKKEYRKLYGEHEELKKRYAELETKIKKNEEEKLTVIGKKRKMKIKNNNKRKKQVILDYDNNNDYNADDDDEDDDKDHEILKVKKKKK